MRKTGRIASLILAASCLAACATQGFKLPEQRPFELERVVAQEKTKAEIAGVLWLWLLLLRSQYNHFYAFARSLDSIEQGVGGSSCLG